MPVGPLARWLFLDRRCSVVVAIVYSAVGGREGGPMTERLFWREMRGRGSEVVHGVARGEEQSQACDMTKAQYIELWQYSISAPFLNNSVLTPQYSHGCSSTEPYPTPTPSFSPIPPSGALNPAPSPPCSGLRPCMSRCPLFFHERELVARGNIVITSSYLSDANLISCGLTTSWHAKTGWASHPQYLSDISTMRATRAVLISVFHSLFDQYSSSKLL